MADRPGLNSVGAVGAVSLGRLSCRTEPGAYVPPRPIRHDPTRAYTADDLRPLQGERVGLTMESEVLFVASSPERPVGIRSSSAPTEPTGFEGTQIR